MKFERKCPECKKLLTIDFVDNNDMGTFYCCDCNIYLDEKGNVYEA